jgi:magnesium transporter
MRHHLKIRQHKIGKSPGTIAYIGEQKMEKVRVELIYYNKESLEQTELVQISDLDAIEPDSNIFWLNIYGLHNHQILSDIGSYFNIHPLVLEDIVNTDQRPKVELYDHFTYVVLKMISYDTDKSRMNYEQVSMLLGSNFVITFQEQEGDLFNPIRERLKNEKGRLRNNGADYLLYAINDIIVDHYFIVHEKIQDQIDKIETEVMRNSGDEHIEEIHHFKREVIQLRKSIWPLRDMIQVLQRNENELIAESTLLYLRDVQDHILHVIEAVEALRDMSTSLMETYYSTISQRMNEVMKVLTMIATIFIPLSFIAAVYGMNFESMPELRWQYGYISIWVLMIGLAGMMVVYFRRKKWL